MIDDGRWLIKQTLAGGQEAAAKLRILTPYFAARARAEVGAKKPVLFEHRLPKCHIRAIGSLFKFARFVSEIEECGNCGRRTKRAIERHPRRRREGPIQKDSPSRPCPSPCY